MEAGEEEEAGERRETVLVAADEVEAGSMVLRKPPARERAARVANELLLSGAVLGLQLLVLALSLFLVVYGAAEHSLFSSLDSEDEWYIALDVLVSVLFAVEVLIRLTAARGGFFRLWSNRIDFGLCVVSFLALALYLVDPESAVVGSAVLLARYLVQTARLAAVLNRHRKMRAAGRAQGGVGRRAAAGDDDIVDFGRAALLSHDEL